MAGIISTPQEVHHVADSAINQEKEATLHSLTRILPGHSHGKCVRTRFHLQNTIG